MEGKDLTADVELRVISTQFLREEVNFAKAVFIDHGFLIRVSFQVPESE